MHMLIAQTDSRHLLWLQCTVMQFLYTLVGGQWLALYQLATLQLRHAMPWQHRAVVCLQWEATLKALVAAGKTELYELGPGAQIKSMLKRIDNGVWKSTKTVAA